MANQRGTFAKRQRETDLKDKARQKLERRAAKRNEVRTTKGPQIDWSEVVTETVSEDELPPETAPSEEGSDTTTTPE
jgi:hypothetical protein